MASMVNMNSLLSGKDSRWLQLEVCREFQRNKCSRPDTECKFAHPPANVEVQNGRVTACYDSIKVSFLYWSIGFFLPISYWRMNSEPNTWKMGLERKEMNLFSSCCESKDLSTTLC